MKIEVTKNNTTETHDVKNVEHRDEQNGKYWVVKSIQPSETEVIESSLTWLSGNMADPRSYEGEETPFPCVYIPKDSEYEVNVL
jgi:hypothetical protein